LAERFAAVKNPRFVPTAAASDAVAVRIGQTAARKAPLRINSSKDRIDRPAKHRRQFYLNNSEKAEP
jgi:hypothetical protein